MRRLAIRAGGPLLAVGLLTSCASWHAPTSNDGGCISPMLSPPAIDADMRRCGLLVIDEQGKGVERARACLRQAQADGVAAHYGWGGSAPDAWFCKQVLLRPDGRVWALDNTYDLTLDPEWSFFVMNCDGLRFDDDPGATAGDFYELGECIADPAAAAGVNDIVDRQRRRQGRP